MKHVRSKEPHLPPTKRCLVMERAPGETAGHGGLANHCCPQSSGQHPAAPVSEPFWANSDKAEREVTLETGTEP